MTEPREDAGTQASAEQDKESEGCCWQFMAADDYRRTLAHALRLAGERACLHRYNVEAGRPTEG